MMAYISDKKWNKMVLDIYNQMYSRSERTKTEKEIDLFVEKNKWTESYKELYFKDPIVFDELKAFAIDNKIQRPGCPDDGRFYLPYEFYILDESIVDEIFDKAKTQYKLTKTQVDQLRGAVGLGVAPLYRYKNKND